MRFQVPQFVDIEDKIIGPFTLKQFLMYVVAVMVLVPVYLFSDFSLFLTMALPVMGTAAAFAHARFHGQSLAELLAASFFFYTKGQLWVWRREAGQKPLVIIDASWHELSAARVSSEEDLVSLVSLARGLETGGNVVNSEEIEDEFDTESSA